MAWLMRAIVAQDADPGQPLTASPRRSESARISASRKASMLSSVSATVEGLQGGPHRDRRLAGRQRLADVAVDDLEARAGGGIDLGEHGRHARRRARSFAAARPPDRVRASRGAAGGCSSDRTGLGGVERARGRSRGPPPARRELCLAGRVEHAGPADGASVGVDPAGAIGPDGRRPGKLGGPRRAAARGAAPRGSAPRRPRADLLPADRLGRPAPVARLGRAGPDGRRRASSPQGAAAPRSTKDGGRPRTGARRARRVGGCDRAPAPGLAAASGGASAHRLGHRVGERERAGPSSRRPAVVLVGGRSSRSRRPRGSRARRGRSRVRSARRSSR